jgi:formyltetrahydrofolate deformylase
VKRTATLLITCPDRKGLVAAIADFLYKHNGNIIHSDQHEDLEQTLFLMRIEWDLEGFAMEPGEFAGAFGPLARSLQMSWRLALSTDRPRVALFVSRYDHCLADLLYRHRTGELRCEIPLILSNHEDHRSWAEAAGIPYHVVPVTAEGKAEAEARQRALLAEHRVDLIVLARYMQVLSTEFTRAYPGRIINIHHSFLPAFLGAKPYLRAFQRGVKLIGATAHYVTQDLDDGPIIEQDVTRISHRDGVDDLIAKGRDLEKMVLSRAVKWHLENRVIVYGNKTVVFD